MDREKILVILASRLDRAAAGLAERWAPHGARLMTPGDLSREGWRDQIPAFKIARSTAVVGGQEVRFDEIEGVLVRLPWVTEHELDRVARADRSYVASEISSYLLSWLSRLHCPVLNRPSAMSLSGPAWRSEQWIFNAAKLGIQVKTVRRSSAAKDKPDALNEPIEVVTVVGDRTFGQVSAQDAQHALKLAQHARVNLMSASFSNSVLVNANCWPSLESDEVSTAVLAYLSHRPPMPSSSGAVSS